MSENLYTGYLFVHFTGEEEQGEQVYFSMSRDGLHWKDLNQGQLIIESTVGERGVRDPFIIRSHEGDRFFIIATDLRIASGKGWEIAQYQGSQSIVIWESDDLVHWSKERIVKVGVKEAGCVWAPEAIYQEEEDQYMVFWASMVKEDGESSAKQRIYCSFTKDFLNFTEPVKYIERENHVIDTTMIYEEGTYYRYSKDETTKNIRVDRNTKLDGENFEEIHSEVLCNFFGVEGPAIFRFNDRKEWCLLVDKFATDGGYVPLTTKDLGSGEFKILASSEYDMGITKKRHGSILKLTEVEYQRLAQVWG